MAKLKTSKKRLVRQKGAVAPCETIKTIYGTEIPAIELAHIAPQLQRFAVPIDSLHQDPHNARRHDDRDLKATQNSMRQFGQQHLVHFQEPDRIIKVGNGRQLCGKALGWNYLAAIPTNLTGAKLKTFALADNRTGELADYFADVLREQRDEVQEAGIDMTGMGLSDEELDELVEEAESYAKDASSAAIDPATFQPVGAETQSRLDQRKAIACPHCGETFVPGANQRGE